MRVLKVMARAYAPPEGMNALIAFYERLTGERCQFRLALPALGLEIASVGSVHLLAGLDESLAPFRAAHATFFVDSVAQAAEELERMSAETSARGK